MFDTYRMHSSGDQHHHHDVTITEKRAPTDESVKLLREMGEAAVNNILASVRLEGCEVECVVHHQRSIVLGLDHEFAIQYRLGNKRSTVRYSFRPRLDEDAEQSRHRLADELVKAVSESIARQILAPAMDKAIRASDFPGIL